MARGGILRAGRERHNRDGDEASSTTRTEATVGLPIAALPPR